MATTGHPGGTDLRHVTSKCCSGSQTWTEAHYWAVPGFRFLVAPPQELRICLIGGKAAKGRPAPVVDPDERQQSALNFLERFFTAMLAGRQNYRGRQRAFFRKLKKHIPIDASHCRKLERLYVAARRSYLEQHHRPSHPTPALTSLVDQWILFRKTGTVSQWTPAPERQTIAQALSPPDSAQTSQQHKARAPTSVSPTPDNRKRSAPTLEASNPKRLHISVEGDQHASSPDHGHDQEASSIRGQQTNYEGDDLLVSDDPEATTDMPFIKRSSSSVEFSFTRPATTSSLADPEPATDGGDVSSGADLEQQQQKQHSEVAAPQRRHNGCKARQRKLRAQTTAQAQRLDDLEQRVTATDEQAVALVQASADSETAMVSAQTDLEQRITVMEEHVIGLMEAGEHSRATIAGVQTDVGGVLTHLGEHAAAVRGLSRRVDSVADLGERQNEDTAKLDAQLVRMGRSLEGILDRYQLWTNRAMERLRETVAEHEGRIAEQARVMEEMREEMSKLAEQQKQQQEQMTGFEERGNGGLGAQEDKELGGGLLWTPRK